jgi:hypothetical protein
MFRAKFDKMENTPLIPSTHPLIHSSTTMSTSAWTTLGGVRFPIDENGQLDTFRLPSEENEIPLLATPAPDSLEPVPEYILVLDPNGGTGTATFVLKCD